MSGASSVDASSPKPIVPPTTLAANAVESRTTSTSRSVTDVIEVSSTLPKSYSTFTSPSTNRSANGSSNCVKSWRSPRVTAGRVVVYGLARMLYASIRFQPSIETSWYMTRGVIESLSFGCTRTATRAPVRRPPFTSSSTLPSGCTASMKPPSTVL